MTDAAPNAVAPPQPSLLADLVTLTKPRIISLLLVTTIAPMFITPAGMPGLGLIGWLTLAGYLTAGGANAINLWFDEEHRLDDGLGLCGREQVDQLCMYVPRPGPTPDVRNTLVVDRDDGNAV